MKIVFTPNNFIINDKSYPYELAMVEVNLRNKQAGWKRIILSLFIYSLILMFFLVIPFSGTSLYSAESLMLVLSFIIIPIYIMEIFHKYMFEFAYLGLEGEKKKYFLNYDAQNRCLISLIVQKGGTVTYNYPIYAARKRFMKKKGN